MARIRIKQGRHADAIPWLTRALEEEDDSELRGLRAEAYEQTGQREHAAADYRRLLSASESQQTALEGLLRNLETSP